MACPLSAPITRAQQWYCSMNYVVSCYGIITGLPICDSRTVVTFSRHTIKANYQCIVALHQFSLFYCIRKIIFRIYKVTWSRSLLDQLLFTRSARLTPALFCRWINYQWFTLLLACFVRRDICLTLHGSDFVSPAPANFYLHWNYLGAPFLKYILHGATSRLRFAHTSSSNSEGNMTMMLKYS